MHASWQSKPLLGKRKLACDPRQVTEALWTCASASAKLLMVFALSTSWVCCEMMYRKGFANVTTAYKCMKLILGPYKSRPAFINDLECL